ncbi:MAG: hypothetical protein HRT45_14130 [Bdellovibrionales bacterium]|nr:hypothetical protein [Bdellovibrionales bacterium]
MFFDRHPFSIINRLNPLLQVIVVVLVGLSLSRCGLQVDEEPAGRRDIKVGDQVGCLSDIGKTTIDFLEANAENDTVEETLSCLAFSIEAFERHTKGRNQDVYEPKEVRDFLQKFFLNRREDQQTVVLNDAFLEEIMHLKAMLIGGSPQQITRRELNRFVERLSEIKRALLVVNPYMSIVNWAMKSDSKTSHQDTGLSADLGQAALKTAVEIFVKALPNSEHVESGYQYDLNRVGSLIKEFRRFIKYDTRNARDAEVWGEFIKEFHMFTSGGREKLGHSDVTGFLRAFASWYGWMGVVRVDFQARQGSFFYGDKFSALDKVLRQLFPMLRRVIGKHPGGELKWAKIESFAVSLEKMNMIPFGIQGSSMASVVREFVIRVLGTSELPSELRYGNGISAQHIDDVLYEYNLWYQVQRFLSDNRSHARLDQEMLSSLNHHIESFVEMSDLIKELRPVIPNDYHSIVLVEAEKLEAYNYYHDASDLTMMNLFRALFRLTVRGFGDYDPDMPYIQQGMTSDQFQAVYDAIRPIGIDARLMDPRAKGSGHRSFLEANLFTYKSNGFQTFQSSGSTLETLVSFAEGVQYLTYLYSASQVSKRAYDELKRRVPYSSEDFVDINGVRYLDRRQATMNLAPVLFQQIETMPGLTEYLASANGQQRQEFAEALFSAAKSDNSHDQWLEKFELDVAVAVLHYSESVMTRFNRNGDEFLSDREVERAYPVFQEFLRDMIKKMCVQIPDSIDEDWFLLHVFREIVTTGKIPSGDMSRIGRIGMIIKFIKRDYLWSLDLDRLAVIKVFSSVVAKSAEAASKKGDNPTCAEPEVEPTGPQ